MPKRSFTLFAGLAILYCSCRTARLSRAEDAGQSGWVVKEEVLTTPPVAIKIPPARADTMPYHYLVSFYSPGDGIDHETASAFEAFLKEEISQKPEKLSFERVPWGREGELDFCIRIHSFNDQERSGFDQALRQVISKSKKVKVYENQPCRYLKRR